MTDLHKAATHPEPEDCQFMQRAGHAIEHGFASSKPVQVTGLQKAATMALSASNKLLQESMVAMTDETLYTAESLQAWEACDAAIAALREALAAPVVPELTANCMPPATRRDQWFYEQGRLAERDPRSHPSIEDLCARIKAADDAAADGDYMLDSNDCISVLRGTWKAPLAMDKPDKPAAPVVPKTVQERNNAVVALYDKPVVPPGYALVPESVHRAAKAFVADDYRGPLPWAKLVFDWVASQPAAPQPKDTP